MDSKLFKAFRRRNVYQINKLAGGNPHIFQGKSPQGNTALHLAARLGDKHVVKEILRLEPSFLYERNRNRETPMHIAAKAGNASVIEVFFDYDYDNNRIVRAAGQENILWMRDKNGDAPLHKAVQNHHDLVAVLLINKGPETILFVNGANQSPLSIAIDISSTYIAWVLIKEHPSSLDYRGLDDLTLFHCAVIRQNYDSEKKGELINTQDVHRRTPVHYAAVLGNAAIARRLLQADNGQYSVFIKLVNGYPDAIDVLNGKQRSILHLAALNGNVKTVQFILTLPEMEDLMNSIDEDGNTPLHLAAMNFHGKVVDILSKNERVNIRATNYKQLTALTIVQVFEKSKVQSKNSIKQRPMKLRCGGTLSKYSTGKILKEAIRMQAFYPGDILQYRSFHAMERDVAQNKYKENREMAQTLLVMATLIASFTFTAAFTIPGGYKSDNPNEGMALLVRKPGLQAFVITVTVAMISSMTAAVLALGQIHYGNDESYTNVNLIPLATTLIWLGLLSMSLAFVTGLFLVLSNNMPLAIVVVCIGCAFPFLLYVFGPFLGYKNMKILQVHRFTAGHV
ncbi:hypothetical protein ACOSQ3_031056 [Xanthoceras sorbifolium]